MRRAVEGLGTPYPIGTLLPAIFQEDPLLMQWTQALDEVLAPAISALDCLPAYLDPLLAPPDFTRWLAGWLGAVLDENWPLERQRAAVAHSVSLYRQRGTTEGIKALLELVTGGAVDVTDNGAVHCSTTPNAPLPGEPGAHLTVRVHVQRGAAIDTAALDHLLATEKPAHVTHRLEVVEQ